MLMKDGEVTLKGLCVLLQVFACITQLHSSKPAENEAVYPHLKALLHYNTREFLNVLALVGRPNYPS
jgi:hypothetical protein